jgi:hypothetical protein
MGINEMSATTNANGLHLRRGPSGERGVVLLAVVTVALVVSVAAGSYLALAGFAVKGVETWREQDQCLLAALSAMEEVKADSHRAFNTYFEALPLSHTVAKFDWFDSWTATTLGADGAYTLPQSADRDGASVSAEVVDVSAPAVHRRVVTFGLTASLGSSQRRILESVSYQLGPSRIFGYGYFVNNSAWLGGAGVTIMGDVRANGNVYCIDSPTINGHVIGGVNPELGTLGIVDGSWSFESLADYYLSAAVQARPGNPPSPGYVGDWELGYDGAPRGFEGLPKLRMPDLEDLGDYEAMALSVGSHIDQGGVRLVDGVYDGPGPDGLAGTCDDGVLVLVGTAADPIEINGPIVTRGDVLIKGYVTGQGTIYSERNIHIVDNVEYVNPPAWIKPDPTPELTAQANESADFLGLAAKGNIIMTPPPRAGTPPARVCSARPTPRSTPPNVRSTPSAMTRTGTRPTDTCSTATTRVTTAATASTRPARNTSATTTSSPTNRPWWRSGHRTP